MLFLGLIKSEELKIPDPCVDGDFRAADCSRVAVGGKKDEIKFTYWVTRIENSDLDRLPYL